MSKKLYLVQYYDIYDDLEFFALYKEKHKAIEKKEEINGFIQEFELSDDCLRYDLIGYIND